MSNVLPQLRPAIWRKANPTSFTKLLLPGWCSAGSLPPQSASDHSPHGQLARRLRHFPLGRQLLLATTVIANLMFLVGTATGADSLWVSTAPLDASRQLLMVVDQQRQTLAVYHIDTASGEVTLRSTRALAFDLQLEDFNATDPKPAALKKMLQIGGDAQPLHPPARSQDGPRIIPTPPK